MWICGALKMGTVILTMRMMPKDAEVDIERWKDEVKNIIGKYGELLNAEVEPIAFGLKALKITFSLEDKEGLMDNVENELKTIEGVGELSVVSMGRSLE